MAKLGGEVRDPAQTLPRALALGVTIVTIVYVLTSAVFVYLVRPEEVLSASAFAAQVGEVLFGRAGGSAFAVIVIVCVLGSLAAVLMAAPRVYHAMGQDGLFPRSLSGVDPRFGTPARAILVQAALACLLVLAGTFGQIIAYFIFVTLLFIALTVAAVLVRPRAAVGVYRMPAFPMPALVFLALILILEVILAGGQPAPAALGVLVVALGIPVYRLFAAGGRRRREETP